MNNVIILCLSFSIGLLTYWIYRAVKTLEFFKEQPIQVTIDKFVVNKLQNNLEQSNDKQD